MADAGFDFIDLTLEPPFAAVRNLDLQSVRTALEDHQLPVVGHTAYYLPLCHPSSLSAEQSSTNSKFASKPLRHSAQNG